MRSTHEEGAQICLVTQGNACGALKVWVVCEYKATHHFIFLFPERWMILKKIKRERACVSVSVSGDGVPQLYLVKDHVFAFFLFLSFLEEKIRIQSMASQSSPVLQRPENADTDMILDTICVSKTIVLRS